MFTLPRFGYETSMTSWAVRHCLDHCDRPPRLRCMRPSQIVETMCSRRFDIVVRHTERLFSCLGCFAGCVDTALSRSITHLPLPPGKKDDTQSRCLTRAQHRLVSYIARIRCLSVTRGQRRLHRSGYSLMRGSSPWDRLRGGRTPSLCTAAFGWLLRWYAAFWWGAGAGGPPMHDLARETLDARWAWHNGRPCARARLSRSEALAPVASAEAFSCQGGDTPTASMPFLHRRGKRGI